MSGKNPFPWLVGSFEDTLDSNGIQIPKLYLDGSNTVCAELYADERGAHLACQSDSRFLAKPEGLMAHGRIPPIHKVALRNGCFPDRELLAAIGVRGPGDSAIVAGSFDRFEIWSKVDWMNTQWTQEAIEALLFG